jgi:hypothetical protein
VVRRRGVLESGDRQIYIMKQRIGRSIQTHPNDILLFLMLLIGYIYFFPRWADWSQNSRLDLTLAIVDKGTLSIEDYYRNTGDYALFEGRHYLDKAPGPSFLAVPVYATMRPILHSGPVQGVLARVARNPAFTETLREGGTGLLEDKIYNAIVLYIVTIVTVSIPAAILGVLLYRFLTQLGAGRAWSAAIVLIYGLATSAFPYSGAFYSHQIVAFLLFGAFLTGFQMRQEAISPRWTLAAGLMLGYSLICEYPTLLIAGAIALYIVFTIPQRRWLTGLVLAGIPPGLLMMGYNWLIFHTPLPVGYEYSELYTEQHSVGLFSLSYPHPDALWGITFGSFRGLFYVSPILLLAIVGFWAWWRMRRLRAECVVCLWATISFFLFNGTSVMWQGGFSIGPRYLVPMLPFMSMGLGAFAVSWGKSPWIRRLTAVLTVWSVVVVWAETLGGQGFPDWTLDPLFNYSLPRLAANDIARNLGMALGLRGWASLIPLGGGLAVMIVLLFWQLRGQRASQADEPIQTEGDWADEASQA